MLGPCDVYWHALLRLPLWPESTILRQVSQTEAPNLKGIANPTLDLIQVALGFGHRLAEPMEPLLCALPEGWFGGVRFSHHEAVLSADRGHVIRDLARRMAKPPYNATNE